MSAGAVPSPVRVSQLELLGLAAQASGMRLDAMRARAIQTGGYVSALRGRGMEYDESRPYQEGDDPRTIDWRVTARTGRPHTKVFREERERPVLLWVDLRPPMFFATRGVFKAVAAARAAALLAWTASQQGDRVGALVVGGDDHAELRPARGRQAVFRLIDALLDTSGWEAALPASQFLPTSVSLSNLAQVVRPGTRVFLLSDFQDFDQTAATRVHHIAQHSEVVTLLFHDLLERELPPAARYRLLTSAGEQILDTTSPDVRAAHAARFEQRRARLLALARFRGIKHLECATDDDVVALLCRRFRRGSRGR
jgi:uncharacterized protein (DUF58 family)